MALRLALIAGIGYAGIVLLALALCRAAARRDTYVARPAEQADRYAFEPDAAG